jgi:predicted transcriptional regulator
MSTLSLRLPESLHRRLSELAEKEGVSINQLISSAVAEKMSALLAEEYLAERAARGKRSRFDQVLAKIPDVEPDAKDRLERQPAKGRRPTKALQSNDQLPRSARSRGRR